MISDAAYCLCKDGNEQVLQKAIDYACGNGADCSQIQTTGACYQPNTVKNHCDVAVNSYYQKKVSSGATCDFNGAAILSQTPSSTHLYTKTHFIFQIKSFIFIYADSLYFSNLAAASSCLTGSRYVFDSSFILCLDEFSNF